ncbi:tetratricopeptide repeat protein [Ferruginibacter sp.]
MKIIVPQSFVKFPLIFIVFCLSITQVCFAQDCKTQAANKPSTLTNSSDNVSSPTGKMNPTEMAKMKPYLARAEAWTKKIVTNFTGAKLDYHNNFFPDFLKDGTTNKNLYDATGIKSYCYSQLMFFAYYCYDNSNTIHTEGESGSSVYVIFNNVFASGFTSDEGIHTVNGKPAFKAIKKKKTEGRTDYYELLGVNNANGKMFTSNDYIILRNSDKPVFIPVTRKEYLQQMLKDVDNAGTSNSKILNEGYESNVKMFELEMKVYKEKDKSYTPEKEAKRRKWFEEDQEKLKKSISKINPDAAAAKEVILQYLKKPQEWLNKNVKRFCDDYSNSAAGITNFFENIDKVRMNGVGEIEEETAEEIVAINPEYFNKTLSSDVPQVIMVKLRGGSYPHMQKVAALVKKPGALAPLEAILNPGKSPSPVVTPSEIVSTYSLKYLPKLKTLTPLIVPAGMKPSVIPVTVNYNNAPPAALNFTLPPLSAKLNQTPQLVTAENYTAYLQQLHTAISKAVKPNEKKKADDYVKNKKITQSNQISNTAFAAWLQNAPAASLYLYSKAVLANTSDVLAANNFSAFLIMGGLPEKSIPILEYWNKQKTGEANILSNLGNAYYRLGDVNKAMQYLQQCVQKDTLNPIANKILCLLYLKKGDAKKAEEHATKSIAASYDQEVEKILRQLNKKAKPGEVMTRYHKNEFPLLKRIKMPAMPASLDDMKIFAASLEAEKKSVDNSIAAIQAKMPTTNDDANQRLLMAGLRKGISPLQMKAQFIIMDAMEIHGKDGISEADVFKYYLSKISAPHNVKLRAIAKKYGDQLNKLEGGEAGDEDKIAALELAKCKDINDENGKYLAELSPLVNEYVQRQEYISRRYYRDYANWAPYWMPQAAGSFVSIQMDYLKEVSNLLGQYKLISKQQCTFDEVAQEEKNFVLKEWEDEYCANFKGKLAFIVTTITWTCNSWGIEGGEGIVFEGEVSYNDDGSFNDFTIGGGLGESFHVGGLGALEVEAGTSIKEFIKIGKNEATGKWEVKDFGLKADATVEATVGPLKGEVKIAEISVAVNAGVQVSGSLPDAVLILTR